MNATHSVEVREIFLRGEQESAEVGSLRASSVMHSMRRATRWHAKESACLKARELLRFLRRDRSCMTLQMPSIPARPNIDSSTLLEILKGALPTVAAPSTHS